MRVPRQSTPEQSRDVIAYPVERAALQTVP
jgi:hypothetical protein